MALITNPSTIHKSDPSGTGTYVLAQNPNLYEIQRSNNFELLIDIDNSLKDLPRAGTTVDTSDTLTGDGQSVLKLAVSSSFIPHFKQGVIEVKRGNNTIRYAGVPEFDSGDIVINDYIGADAKAYLEAWQNLSYSVATEKVGLASDYKKKCKLIEYSPDYQVVRSITLYGCWISALREDNFDYERNDAHKVTATISYDHAKPDTDDIV